MKILIIEDGSTRQILNLNLIVDIQCDFPNNTLLLYEQGQLYKVYLCSLNCFTVFDEIVEFLISNNVAHTLKLQ